MSKRSPFRGSLWSGLSATIYRVSSISRGAKWISCAHSNDVQFPEINPKRVFRLDPAWSFLYSPLDPKLCSFFWFLVNNPKLGTPKNRVLKTTQYGTYDVCCFFVCADVGQETWLFMIPLLGPFWQKPDGTSARRNGRGGCCVGGGAPFSSLVLQGSSEFPHRGSCVEIGLACNGS